MNCLISIIVPCYNQAKYLDECLQSVFDQTYANWECIVVNDGSPDNTAAVAKKWVVKDARFKYFYRENGGLSSARNFGIFKSVGEWIQFLDCDDFLHEQKFEICLKENLQRNFNLIIHNYKRVQGGLFHKGYYDLSKVDFSYQNILLEWDVSFAIPIHCALFKSDLIKNSKFDERLSSKEDWLFWLEVFRKEVAIQFINKNLCYYRNNTAGMTKNEVNMYINQNKAFSIVYDTLDPKMQKKIFEKALLFSERLLIRKNVELQDQAKDFNILVKSPSFKIGSFILKPFKILKNKF